MVGGLILFGGCVGIVIGSDDKDDAGSSTTTSARPFASPPDSAEAGTEPGRSAPEEEESSGAPGLGQEVRDGKFAFVVTGVQTSSVALGGMSDPPMGEWFIVSMNVTNIGDQQRTFYAGNQTLIDSQGREFESDFWAAEALNDEFSVDLNPGFKISMQVPFDVPPGAVPTAIELHDSAFSGGATVSLG